MLFPTLLEPSITAFSRSEFPLPSEFPSANPAASPTPQPGEIWQLARTIRRPQDNPLPYSLPAQRFLRGELPDRYVMIIRERSPETDPAETWQSFTVMVLSPETNHLSDIDVLIPTSLSGLEQDVLAETWHILPMLGCNLQARCGNRIPRDVYDCLITIGDAHQDGSPPQSTAPEIQSLGLTIAPPLTHQQPQIQAFHQREIAWSDVLRLPFQAYQTHIRALQWADSALTKTLQVEQILQQLTVTPLTRVVPTPRRIALGQWLQNRFEPEWLAIEQLIATGTLHLVTAARAAEADDAHPEIAELIPQLSPDHPETQRRRAAKQLGPIGQGNPTVIQALIALLRSTDDDETLWAAVESLWQIDPGNPAAGVRRVRLLDLGLQVSGRTVALAIAILQRQDQRLGIMLRVYPTENEPYVPEDLKLILIDEANQTYEVSARRNDLYIQLKFNGTPGERFGVQVKLGEAQMTEEFLL
jgi:Protein of unknown function (DUF1822)